MTENDDEQVRSRGTGVSASLTRPGGLSYLEIPAVNARRSAAFYEKAFGWNLRGPDTDDPRFVVPRVDSSNSRFRESLPCQGPTARSPRGGRM